MEGGDPASGALRFDRKEDGVERREENRKAITVTYNQQHKVLQNLLEIAIAGNRNRAIDECADKSPDKSRNHLRPASHDLQTECQAVNIGTIIRNDAEREHDQAKGSEASQGWEEHGC